MSTTAGIKETNNQLSKLVGSDGSPDPALSVDTDGIITSHIFEFNSIGEKSDVYTITDTDGYREVHGTTATDDDAYTLPEADNNLGRKIKLMKVDTGNGTMIVTPHAGDTLNGVANGTWTITECMGWIEVIAISGGWRVIGEHNSCILAYENSSDVDISGGSAAYTVISGHQLTIGIGTWEVSYDVILYAAIGGAANSFQLHNTLSSDGTGPTYDVTNSEFTFSQYLGFGSGVFTGWITPRRKRSQLVLAAATTFYLLTKYGGGGVSIFRTRGTLSASKIEARRIA